MSTSIGQIRFEKNGSKAKNVQRHSRQKYAILAAATMAPLWMLASQQPAAKGAVTYWDTNSNTAGAGGPVPTAGTWGTSAFWSTDSTGLSNTTTWTAGDSAVFSAGSDATGAYTINVDAGGVSVAGITAKDGNPTLAGGNMTLVSPAAISVASGLTLSTSTTISGTAGLTLSGGGTFKSTGAPNFSGNINVSGGSTLSFSAVGSLPTPVAGTQIILNGAKLQTLNTGNAGSYVNFNYDVVAGPAGGTLDYNPTAPTNVTLFNGTLLGQGGTTSNGGAGTFTKTGPGEFRYGGTTAQNGSKRFNTTFAKLVVKQGIFRLGGDATAGNNTELGFGALPLAPLADAITLDGGGIGASFGCLTNTLRGMTLAAGGGTIYGFFGTGGAPITFAGPITGGGSLTLNGATQLVMLSGANTYTGGTIITANNNQVSATGTLGASSGSLTFVAGTLLLKNSAQTVRLLTGPTGTLTLDIANTFTVNGSSGVDDSAFGGTIAGNGQVVKDGTSTLTLTGSNGWFGNLTLKGGTLAAGGSNINGGSGQIIFDGGTLLATSSINTSQTVALNSTGTFNTPTGSDSTLSGTVSGSGSLTKAGTATLQVNGINAGGLAVSAGTFRVAPGVVTPPNTNDATPATAVTLTSAPTFGATGRLDLTNNKMVINYSGASPINAVRAALLNGRGKSDGFNNDETWNGTTGIISSTAGGGGTFSIGYADNSNLPFGSYTSFGGQSVGSSSILIKYTLSGDTNLNGIVDDIDVQAVANNYQQGVGGVLSLWSFGDMDYNNAVDDNDVQAIINNYDPNAVPLSAAQLTAQYGTAFGNAVANAQAAHAAAVPEPASLSILEIGSLALLKRKRKQHQ